jgi:TetR/AcrR family transcriptional regulator, regulator of autoinduction and epiphytic fitness
VGKDVVAKQEAGPVSIFDAVAAPQAALTKRDAILAAATRVFLRHGYEGTSMELVAQESGSARRTLYNQFPEGKEALFNAVVGRVWEAFPVMDIASEPEALADPVLGLSQIGMATAEFWAPPLAVAFLRLVIAEGPRFPKLTESFFGLGKTRAMGAVREYIIALAERGVLVVADAELATRQFLGLIDEPLLWVRVVGKHESSTHESRTIVVDQAVRIFLGHYMKAASSLRPARAGDRRKAGGED